MSDVRTCFAERARVEPLRSSNGGSVGPGWNQKGWTEGAWPSGYGVAPSKKTKEARMDVGSTETNTLYGGALKLTLSTLLSVAAFSNEERRKQSLE